MKFKKITSLCLLLTFVTTQQFDGTGYAASEKPYPHASFPGKMSEISIPEMIGKIQESFQGNTGKSVVIVQDAHAIPEAQKNIQQLIAFFQKQYGVRLIATEGAASRLDAQIFRSFPDRKKLVKVFKRYQEKGELTGSTAAAIFNKYPADYYGVENWPLYDEGLDLFLKAMSHQSELNGPLQVWEDDLQARKNKIYSKDLLTVDAALQAFHGNQTDLAAVIENLARLKPLPKNSMLAAMNSLLRGSGNSFGAFLEETAQKIKTWNSQSKKLSENRLLELNENMQAYAVSKISAPEYAFQLKTVLEKTPAASTVFSGEIEKLGEISAAYHKIQGMEGAAFLKEFETYAKSVKESLMKAPEERTLDLEFQEWLLVHKMSLLEMSREEWEAYSKGGGLHTQKWIHRKALASAEAFYKNAEHRDQVFLENLEKHSRETNAQNSLLIAGGFHAQGLARRLKNKKISYLLVTPELHNLPKEIYYRDQMNGSVFWKRYFDSGKRESSLYDAFVRGTRDQLLAEDPAARPLLLKHWRDQIIRDLANQNRIEKTGDYTGFIDEVSGTLSPYTVDDSLRKIDSFIEGLKQLQTEGRLSPQNILGILKTDGMGSKYTYAVLDRSAFSRPAERRLPAIELSGVSGGSRFESRYSQNPPQEWESLKKKYTEEQKKIADGYLQPYEKAIKHNRLVKQIAAEIYALSKKAHPETEKLNLLAFESEELISPEGRILQDPDDSENDGVLYLEAATRFIFNQIWRTMKFAPGIHVEESRSINSRLAELSSKSTEFPSSKSIGGSDDVLLKRKETYSQFLRGIAALAAEYELQREKIWSERENTVRLRMREHAVLADRMMVRLFEFASMLYPEQTAQMALLVYGGQGRREMHLTSDSEGRMLLMKNPEECAEAIRFIQNGTDWIFGQGSRWLTLLAGEPVQMSTDFEETLESQQNKVSVATELLDARYLTGNKAIAAARLDAFHQQLAEENLQFTQSLIDVWNARYKKNGYLDGLFVREPDVKDGTGGLRTMHYVRWIAQAYTKEPRKYFSVLTQKGLLDKTELKEAMEAYKFINRVRSVLGRMKLNKREPNRLTLDIQKAVAYDMGYLPTSKNPRSEELMLQDYYAHSLTLFRFSYKVIRRISELPEMRPVDEIRTDEKLVEAGLDIEAQIALRGGIVFQLGRGFRRLAKPRRFLVPQREGASQQTRSVRAESILPIFLYAAKHNLKLSGDMLDEIEKSIPAFKKRFEQDREFRNDSKEMFLSLLTCQAPIAYVMERLYLLGILSSFVPEFQEIGYRPHHELDYVTTLDWHALKTISSLDHLMYPHSGSDDERIPETVREFYKKIEKNMLQLSAVRLSLLLQDLDPETTSRVIDSFALDGVTANLIGWFQSHSNDLNELIRFNAFWQGDMLPQFIQREIGSDLDKWRFFIGASLANLDALRPAQFWIYLEAIDPAFIFDPSAGHSADIQRRISYEREVLGRITRHLVGGNKERLRNTAVSVEPLEPEKSAKITVYHRQVQDTPGRLRNIAGVLAANGLVVHSETVGTIMENSDIVNSFVVTAPNLPAHTNEKNSWQELEGNLFTDLTDVMENGASVATIFARRLKFGAPSYSSHRLDTLLPVKTEISFDAEISTLGLSDSSPAYTILRVSTPDRPLLLYALTTIIATHGINIHAGSTVDTEGYDPRIGMRAVDTFFLSYQGTPLSMNKKIRLLNDLEMWLKEGQIDFKNLDRHMELMLFKHNLQEFLDALNRFPGAKPVSNLAYVGDIQGNLTKLDQILDELEKQKTDQVIFAGDFIDRGPHGLAVVDKVRALVAQGKAVAIMGNHEMMFIEAMLSPGYDVTSFYRWLSAGGWDVVREVFGDTVAGVNLSDESVVNALGKNSEEFYDIMVELKHNERLLNTARWLKENLKLYYLDDNMGFTMHARFKLDAQGNILLDFEDNRQPVPRPGREVLESLAIELQKGDPRRSVSRELLNPHGTPQDILFGTQLPEQLIHAGLAAPGFQNLLTQIRSLRLFTAHMEPLEDPREHIHVSEKSQGTYNPIDYGMGKKDAMGTQMSGGYAISGPEGVWFHLLKDRKDGEGISPPVYGLNREELIRQVQDRIEMTIQAIRANAPRHESRDAVTQIFPDLFEQFQKLSNLTFDPPIVFIALGFVLSYVFLIISQRRLHPVRGDIEPPTTWKPRFNTQILKEKLIRWMRIWQDTKMGFTRSVADRILSRMGYQQEKPERPPLFADAFDTVESFKTAWQPWLSEADDPEFMISEESTPDNLHIESISRFERSIAGEMTEVSAWGFSIKRSRRRPDEIEQIYFPRFPSGVEPEAVFVGLLSWLKLRGFKKVRLEEWAVQTALGDKTVQQILDRYFSKNLPLLSTRANGKINFELSDLITPEPFVGQVAVPSLSQQQQRRPSAQEHEFERPEEPKEISVKWSVRDAAGYKAVVSNENGTFNIILEGSGKNSKVMIYKVTDSKSKAKLYETIELTPDDDINFKTMQMDPDLEQVIPDTNLIFSLTKRQLGPSGYQSISDLAAKFSPQLDAFTEALSQALREAPRHGAVKMTGTPLERLQHAMAVFTKKLEEGRNRFVEDRPVLSFESLSTFRANYEPGVTIRVFNKNERGPYEISVESTEREAAVRAAWDLIDQFGWKDVFKGRIDEELIHGGPDEGKTRYLIRLSRSENRVEYSPLNDVGDKAPIDFFDLKDSTVLVVVQTGVDHEGDPDFVYYRISMQGQVIRVSETESLGTWNPELSWTMGPREESLAVKSSKTNEPLFRLERFDEEVFITREAPPLNPMLVTPYAPRSEMRNAMFVTTEPDRPTRTLELSPAYVGTMVPQIPSLIQALSDENLPAVIFGGAVRGLAFATQFDYALPISELDVAIPVARLSSTMPMAAVLAKVDAAKKKYHAALLDRAKKMSKDLKDLDLHITDHGVFVTISYEDLEWGISKFTLTYDKEKGKYLLKGPDQAIRDLQARRIRLLGTRWIYADGEKYRDPERVLKILDQAKQYLRYGFTIDPASLELIKNEIEHPRYQAIRKEAQAVLGDLESFVPPGAADLEDIKRASAEKGKALLEWAFSPASEAERARLRYLHQDFLHNAHPAHTRYFDFEGEGKHFTTYSHESVDWVLKIPKDAGSMKAQYDHLERGISLGGSILPPFFTVSPQELEEKGIQLSETPNDVSKKYPWIVQKLAVSVEEILFHLFRQRFTAASVQKNALVEELTRDIHLVLNEWKKLIYRGWAMGIVFDDYTFKNAGITAEGDVRQLNALFDESWLHFFVGSTSIADLTNNVNRKWMQSFLPMNQAEEIYGRGLDKNEFELLWPSNPDAPLKSRAIGEDKRQPLFASPGSLAQARQQFLKQISRNATVFEPLINRDSRAEFRDIQDESEKIQSVLVDRIRAESAAPGGERLKDILTSFSGFFPEQLTELFRSRSQILTMGIADYSTRLQLDAAFQNQEWNYYMKVLDGSSSRWVLEYPMHRFLENEIILQKLKELLRDRQKTPEDAALPFVIRVIGLGDGDDAVKMIRLLDKVISELSQAGNVDSVQLMGSLNLQFQFLDLRSQPLANAKQQIEKLKKSIPWLAAVSVSTQFLNVFYPETYPWQPASTGLMIARNIFMDRPSIASPQAAPYVESITQSLIPGGLFITSYQESVSLGEPAGITRLYHPEILPNQGVRLENQFSAYQKIPNPRFENRSQEFESIVDEVIQGLNRDLMNSVFQKGIQPGGRVVALTSQDHQLREKISGVFVSSSKTLRDPLYGAVNDDGEAVIYGGGRSLFGVLQERPRRRLKGSYWDSASRSLREQRMAYGMVFSQKIPFAQLSQFESDPFNGQGEHEALRTDGVPLEKVEQVFVPSVLLPLAQAAVQEPLRGKIVPITSNRKIKSETVSIDGAYEVPDYETAIADYLNSPSYGDKRQSRLWLHAMRFYAPGDVDRFEPAWVNYESGSGTREEVVLELRKALLSRAENRDPNSELEDKTQAAHLSEMREAPFIQLLNEKHAQVLDRSRVDVFDRRLLTDPEDVEPIFRKVFENEPEGYFVDLGSWSSAMLPTALFAGARKAFGIEKEHERVLTGRNLLRDVRGLSGAHEFLRSIDAERDVIEGDFLSMDLSLPDQKIPDGANRIYFYYVGSAIELNDENARRKFLEKLAKLPPGTKMIMYRMPAHFQFEPFEIETFLGRPLYEFKHSFNVTTRVYEVPRHENRALHINEKMPAWYFLKAFGFEPENAHIVPDSGQPQWGRVDLPDTPEARRAARQSILRVMISESWLAQYRLRPFIASMVQNPQSDMLSEFYLLTYENKPAAFVFPFLTGEAVVYYPLLDRRNTILFDERMSGGIPLQTREKEIGQFVKTHHRGQIFDVTENPYLETHLSEPLVHYGPRFGDAGLSFPSIYVPGEASTKTLLGGFDQIDFQGKTVVEIGSGNGRVIVEAMRRGALKGMAYETSTLGNENTQLWANHQSVKVHSILETPDTTYESADIYLMNGGNLTLAKPEEKPVDFQSLTYEKARESNISITPEGLQSVFSKAAKSAKPGSHFYLRNGAEAPQLEALLPGTGWILNRVLRSSPTNDFETQGSVYDFVYSPGERKETRNLEETLNNFAQKIYEPVLRELGLDPAKETELAECKMCAAAAPLVTKLAQQYFASDPEVKVELWGGVLSEAADLAPGQSPKDFIHFWTEVSRGGERYYISVMDGQLGISEWAKAPNVQNLSGLEDSEKYNFLKTTPWRIHSGNAEPYDVQRLYRKLERIMASPDGEGKFGGYQTVEAYLNSKVERMVSTGILRPEYQQVEPLAVKAAGEIVQGGNVSPETADKIALADIDQLIGAMRRLKEDRLKASANASNLYVLKANARLKQLVEFTEKLRGLDRKAVVAVSVPSVTDETEARMSAERSAEQAEAVSAMISTVNLTGEPRVRNHFRQALEAKGVRNQTVGSLDDISAEQAPVLPVIYLQSRSAPKVRRENVVHISTDREGYSPKFHEDSTEAVAEMLEYAVAVMTSLMLKPDQISKRDLEMLLKQMEAIGVNPSVLFNIQNGQVSAVMSAVESFITSYRSELRTAQSA